MAMRARDDNQAKIRFWVAAAAQPNFRPPPCPVPANLPPFPPQRFASHLEMNKWKREYLLAIARQGGIQWKKSSPP